MCILTERVWESNRLRASVLFHVKNSGCTQATIKDKKTDGKSSCRYVQVI